MKDDKNSKNDKSENPQEMPSRKSAGGDDRGTKSTAPDRGDRSTSSEGPKTWASAPERPEEEVLGQDPGQTQDGIEIKPVEHTMED